MTAPSNWVLRYREAHGLTVNQFAELAGTEPRNVYRWQRGKLPRSPEVLARLELATGMKIQDLMPEVFDPTR